jgi:glycosyltransferase involved in cell wall biosynthesis
MLVAFNRPAQTRETLEAYSAELRAFCAEVEFWELPFPWKGVRWWAGLLANMAQTLPHACEAYRSPALLQRWSEILRAHSDALIHIDSSDLAVFVPAASGRRVLLNHHNFESAMAERRARLERNPLKRFLLAEQSKRQAALEREICSTVTVNAVVSKEDGELLRLQSPRAHVHVVPNGTDVDYFRVDPTAPRPDTLVFAGSLSWYPNVSGLRYFRDRIWPHLKREVPALECILAGKSPAREIADWSAAEPSVTLVANPDDIRPWIARGSVFICPIVDGGGTRLKLLDAMSSGKAIVSTTVGAEGLGVTSNEQLLLADSPDEFARMTLRLLRDADLRATLSRNARAFVERHFSWHTIGGELEAAYACDGRHRSIE